MTDEGVMWTLINLYEKRNSYSSGSAGWLQYDKAALDFRNVLAEELAAKAYLASATHAYGGTESAQAAEGGFRDRVSVALEIPLRELTDVRADKPSAVPTEDAEKIFALVAGRRRPGDIRRAYKVLEAMFGQAC